MRNDKEMEIDGIHRQFAFYRTSEEGMSDSGFRFTHGEPLMPSPRPSTSSIPYVATGIRRYAIEKISIKKQWSTSTREMIIQYNNYMMLPMR